MWIRGMCRRVVHGIVHRAAMMRVWWYLQLTMGLVSVYETEFVFRSLMAWGKKLFLSLSVFAIMLLKRLPDGSKQKRWLPGWVGWVESSDSWSCIFFECKHLQFTAKFIDKLVHISKMCNLNHTGQLPSTASSISSCVKTLQWPGDKSRVEPCEDLQGQN